MAEPAQDQLLILLFAGTMGVLLLTSSIILFFFIYQKRMFAAQQQKQQLENEYQEKMVQLQLESQEKERIRIASDLHDSLGSLLWSARVNAAVINRITSLSPDVLEAHEALMYSLDQAALTVRRIAWELTPEAFHHAGLSVSLNQLTQRFNGKGIKVDLIEVGHALHWNDDAAIQVYRIVQELINNTMKHSQASELTIALNWKQPQLSIEVIDNGVGFSLAENRSGVGWWNIHQRVKNLNAEISIGIPPTGKGSYIVLTVNLPV